MIRFKRFEGFYDDFNTIIELFFVHNQWWCKSNDISMRGFGQKAVVSQFKANVPSGITLWRIVDNNSIE